MPVKNVALADATSIAAELISCDALALVRFGLRTADDPRIQNTVRLIDRLLKVETPAGPAWLRYNGDGYGEHADGSPFDGTGIGRPWPLLTGERAHFELQGGRLAEANRLLNALESLASDIGMIPEQVWDAGDIPDRELYRGRAAGSAMPLVWAHAEYLKLRRSLRDGRVFDMPPQTVRRYLVDHVASRHTIWRFNHKIRTLRAGQLLRVESLAAAVISLDERRLGHEYQRSGHTRYRSRNAYRRSAGGDTGVWHPRGVHDVLERSCALGRNEFHRDDCGGDSVTLEPQQVLVIDIGGSHIKVRISGQRLPTKLPSGPTLTPGTMATLVKGATADWKFDAVSIGYPGPVVANMPASEPYNLGRGWMKFSYEEAFGPKVRIINDAAMQALGGYRGGRMLFLGLGTGLGSALVVEGHLQPLELAHLPYRKGRTFENYLGDASLKQRGKKRWWKAVCGRCDNAAEGGDAG